MRGTASGAAAACGERSAATGCAGARTTGGGGAATGGGGAGATGTRSAGRAVLGRPNASRISANTTRRPGSTCPRTWCAARCRHGVTGRRQAGGVGRRIDPAGGVDDGAGAHRRTRRQRHLHGARQLAGRGRGRCRWARARARRPTRCRGSRRQCRGPAPATSSAAHTDRQPAAVQLGELVRGQVGGQPARTRDRRARRGAERVRRDRQDRAVRCRDVVIARGDDGHCPVPVGRRGRAGQPGGCARFDDDGGIGERRSKGDGRDAPECRGAARGPGAVDGDRSLRRAARCRGGGRDQRRAVPATASAATAVPTRIRPSRATRRRPLRRPEHDRQHRDRVQQVGDDLDDRHRWSGCRACR